jgi:hypothetical protein
MAALQMSNANADNIGHPPNKRGGAGNRENRFPPTPWCTDPDYRSGHDCNGHVAQNGIPCTTHQCWEAHYCTGHRKFSTKNGSDFTHKLQAEHRYSQRVRPSDLVSFSKYRPGHNPTEVYADGFVNRQERRLFAKVAGRHQRDVAAADRAHYAVEGQRRHDLNVRVAEVDALGVHPVAEALIGVSEADLQQALDYARSQAGTSTGARNERMDVDPSGPSIPIGQYQLPPMGPPLDGQSSTVDRDRAAIDAAVADEAAANRAAAHVAGAVAGAALDMPDALLETPPAGAAVYVMPPIEVVKPSHVPLSEPFQIPKRHRKQVVIGGIKYGDRL